MALAASLVLWQLPASAGDAATAREQLKVGYTLAQEGKCEAAVPHLRESLRLDPKAITLINLADCEEKTGKLADAMGHWVDARSRAQAEGARPIEEEAEKRANALEPRLARLTIVLAPTAPKDVVVERDGVVLGSPSLGIPLPVDPGPHSIVVRAKGRADGAMQITLGEGEAKRIEVDAGTSTGAAAAGTSTTSTRGDAQRRASLSPLVFVGFGVAGAGVALGAVTGMMALNAASNAKDACPVPASCDAQTVDDVEKGRTMGTISTIGFIVAGVGAGVGVYGLLASPKSSSKPRTGSKLGVSVTGSSVSLAGSF